MKPDSKPVVTYEGLVINPRVGHTAAVYGYKGHPRLGDGTGKVDVIFTSVVVAVSEDGNEFETLNTLYRKATA